MIWKILQRKQDRKYALIKLQMKLKMTRGLFVGWNWTVPAE